MRALTITLVLVGAFTTAQAGTIHVPDDYSTIQAAINASITGDLVLVAPGQYVENIDFDGKAVHVASKSGPEVTTIRSANANASTVVFVTHEPVGAEISGFTITGGGLAGIRCVGSSPTIRDNVITGNHSPNDRLGAGVSLENSSHAVIERNIFRGNSSVGYGGSVVLRLGSSGDLIAYNQMYDNVGYGEIRITENTADLRIYNNTIRPTTYSGITHQGTGTMIVQNNIIFDAPYLAIRDDDATGQISYNCTYNNNYGGVDYPYGVDATNFRANPLFVDVAARDFRLQPLSPCINAGNPDPIFNDPDGTRNDIGALTGEMSLPGTTAVQIVDENQTHVTNHQPEFVWSYYDSPISDQVAYEIEIGSDLDWNVAEMWAPGQISTSDQTVIYGGAPLEDGITYHGRIRVFNGTKWGDWRHFLFRMNSVPPSPTPDSPVGGALTSALNTKLRVTNTSDPESDPLTYDFQVYSDAGMSSLVAELDDVAQQAGTTESGRISGLTPDNDYWWRARASDGFENAEWSAPETFHTRSSLTLRVPEDYPTIALAYANAGGGDVILVGPGTYAGGVHITVSGISLRSVQGASETFITGASGGSSLLDLAATGGLVNVEGFTFLASHSTPALTIRANVAATVKACTFSGNSASDGGGILCLGTDVMISGCVFEANEASHEGGGIYIRGSLVTVEG